MAVTYGIRTCINFSVPMMNEPYYGQVGTQSVNNPTYDQVGTHFVNYPSEGVIGTKTTNKPYYGQIGTKLVNKPIYQQIGTQMVNRPIAQSVHGYYLDDVGQPIEWTCTSQRLHFNAPNNYKHIKSISIITSQNERSMLRCKLELKSYHNLQNLTDIETVEYELDQVTTAIYKVNFLKLNAFQFTISSDRTVKPNQRHEFITPDIALKYRVTERVR